MQSPFLERIGGNDRVRASVGNALADATRGVTAKIRWLSRAVSTVEDSHEEGRPRWIHCTPLLGSSGAVGVWMVVLIDEDRHSAPSRRFRQAPPIANDVRNNNRYNSPSTRNRLDDYEELDFEGGHSTRSTSRADGNLHGNVSARHMVVDNLRAPASPRSPTHMYEQRTLRSASSSVRDYALGHHNGSTETFDI
jgi:hypothetical protein